MTTFLDTAERIVRELRRSNLLEEAKQAVNDAIKEAAKTRFYFNEMQTSFPTVAGIEEYPDLGFVELDAIWYWQGNVVNGARYNIYTTNQLDANDARFGNPSGGQLDTVSHYGGKLRFQPVPNGVTTIYLEGFGRLTPYPMVNDNDTNAWLDDGEEYIRALAKRFLLQDVVRDYREASVYDTIADGFKDLLVSESNQKLGTDYIKATQF